MMNFIKVDNGNLVLVFRRRDGKDVCREFSFIV